MKKQKNKGQGTRDKKLVLPEGIYLAITERFCRNGSAIKTLKQAIKGGVKIVQLREKDYIKPKILKMAREFRKITKKAGVMFIMNDHLDIALKVRADGVHLGPEDMKISTAKRKAPRLIIGGSAYSVPEAVRLEKQGADYVNIGAVFATKTKKLKAKPVGLAGVKKTVAKLKIPVTVMGGIKQRHIPGIVKAGALRIAVITDITKAADVENKVRILNKRIKKAKNEKK